MSKSGFRTSNYGAFSKPWDFFLLIRFLSSFFVVGFLWALTSSLVKEKASFPKSGEEVLITLRVR